MGAPIVSTTIDMIRFTWMFALALAPALPAGCIYNGNPVHVGSQNRQCEAGQECACTGAGSCAIECSGPDCGFVCDSLGDCSFECPDGGCDALCRGGGSCTLTCPDGDCTMTCAGAGSCELVGCDEGDCDLICQNAGACEQTD